MNLGALVGFLMDLRERQAFIQNLKREEVGFRELPYDGPGGACWLWRFRCVCALLPAQHIHPLMPTPRARCAA
jgi:hypothetical protein